MYFSFIISHEQGKELHIRSLRVTELTSELENMKTENSKLRQQTFDNEKKAKDQLYQLSMDNDALRKW